MKKQPSTSPRDRIELRSHKVRHIISEAPSALLRHGTLLILIIFILLILIAALVPVTVGSTTSTFINLLRGAE